MTPNDTIAAIATAPGESGISIVRISGPDALNIADRVFRCRAPKPSERPANTFALGHVIDEEGPVDQAILLIMRAPQSYTGEDVAEIQGHGGSASSRRVLRCVLEAGARSAGPGEFTQRAFLNGRIDLLQAEAVLDLIRARSDRAAAAAMEQLEGGLSSKFNLLYDQLIDIAADLEASMDFPEDELPVTVLPDILRRTAASQTDMDRLIATWDEGHLLRDGAVIVISGKPNVGKSTLLNRLLGMQRAIVSPIPGTTRDTIEEGYVLDGIPIRIVDTAGLRDTENVVEQEGVERAHSHIQRADLHIHILDASEPSDDSIRSHLAMLPRDRTILVLNKTDLVPRMATTDIPAGAIPASFIRDIGLDAIRTAMRAKLTSGTDFDGRPHAAISERHRALLLEAQGEMQQATDLLKGQRKAAVPLAASALRSAIEHIGTATGRSYHDDLLSSIFSRFCIGK